MPKGVYDRSTMEHHKVERKLVRVPKGQAKRCVLDKEKDLWLCVQLAVQGMTYKEIAEELKKRNGYEIDYTNIKRNIDQAIVEWKRENLANIDVYIAKDLYRIEELERIVTADYEKSKALRPHEYAALMKRGMSIEEIDEMYKDRPLPGDPKYFDTLIKLQTQRMRLLGIDKGNDVSQQTIVNYNFGDMSDEALARLADGLQDNKYKEIVAEEVTAEEV